MNTRRTELGHDVDALLGDILKSASGLALAPKFQKDLHAHVMAAVASERCRAASAYAASEERRGTQTPPYNARFFLAHFPRPAYAYAAAIFLLAISLLTWHHTPVITSTDLATPAEPTALMVVASQASSVGAVQEPPSSGAIRELPLRNQTARNTQASTPPSIARASRAGVSPAKSAEVNFFMRYDGSTVLEWNGSGDALYRVYRSPEPDIQSARYVEWKDVRGTQYRDDDPRPGTRYYRVERVS